MAEEDNELLDWGGEDDVVSLGDEEESCTFENMTLPSQNIADSPLVASEARTPPRSRSPLPIDSDSSTGIPDQNSKSSLPSTETSRTTSSTTPQSSHKLTILPRLTHALPPKPMTASVPYVPPSDPSIVEATAMAVRAKKSDTTTATTHNLKSGSRQDHIGPLPAPWEVCIPRSGNGIYYLNSQTGQTQWDRPSAPPVVSPPAALSHDDRHYRPSDDRYPSHGRHHPTAPARSPRNHNRSRSTSPPPTSRDSRARNNNQRPAKGRSPIKTDVPQRESGTGDLPKVDDRHWVPSPPSSNNKARNGRRQRRQNHSMDGRVADSGPEEVDQPLPQRDVDIRSHNGKEPTYTPSDVSSNRASAPRPATPPPRDEHPITHQIKAEVPRESFQERRRSPGPTRDQRLPESSFRRDRERPSRFGPGQGPSSAVPDRSNGLPMKPTVTHSDRSGDVRRAHNDRPYSRRAEQDRDRYEDSNLQDGYSDYVAPTTRSPMLTRDQVGNSDRTWVPADDRGKTLSGLGDSSSRKRPPLPPQDAEFRETARPRPTTYPEPTNQRQEVPRRPATSFHDRDQVDRVANPPRSLPPREDARDVPYIQAPLPRNSAPADYDRSRDYERDRERDRPRSRQHFNEQDEFQRGYDRSADLGDTRGVYAEREREPPSKPRAMQGPASLPSSAYIGPPNPGPAPNRYHDRPSPPHLSTVADSRRDIDVRPAPPPSSWPERRETKGYHPPSDRPPRGRNAPTSSANSIPIGNKRVFSPAEPPISDYQSPAPNDRYRRPSHSAQDLPRPVKNDYPRSYPEPELAPDVHQKYPRASREPPFPQAPPDDRAFSRRGEKAEPIPRVHVLPPIPQPDNPPRPRHTRFSSDNRNPHFDHEPVVDLPPSKPWSGDSYDTSPRGRFRDELVREATPPPLSRETSFTSPQWDPPSSSSSLHDPHRYHELPPPPISRMDVDPPGRQAPGAYSTSAGERYRREEVDFREPVRPPLPPPRVGGRRDQASYSPEISQRAPIEPPDGIERDGGLMKRNPSTASFDDKSRNQRPWVPNERHPLPPPPLPEARGGHKQTQDNHKYLDNTYNGEPPDFDARQADYAPLPAKTFEQRLSAERPPMPSRGASLLSRISRGDDDAPPPPPSLRDRVQIGIKRDRDQMFRDPLPDRPLDVDDGEADYPGARRGKKRRRNRRGGPPS